MKKNVSIITTAILTAAIAVTGSMTAFAEEAATTAATETAIAETTTTVAATTLTETTTLVETTTLDETTTLSETTTQAATTTTAAATDPAPSISVQDIVGKWKYQDAGKDNGTVEIKADGTYTYTDAAGKTSNGTVKIGTETVEGTTATTVNFYVDETRSFGGYYRSTEISLGNGGVARLVKDNGAASTTATAATTASKASTTTAKTTTTDKATTTTSSKTSSPKTGVSFPGFVLAGLAAAAAAATLTLKKKD